MAWTLTAGGTDIITRVQRGSLRIQQRAYRSAAVMTFEVEDFGKTVTVSPEQEIILTEDGTRRFAGHVKGRGRSHRGHTLSRVYDITCADYSALLDMDVVSSPSVRSTAETDKARISWLMSTFGSHGITYSNLVTQYVASMPEQDFTGMTLRESLTQIAKYSWARFYVDFNKELVFTKTANAVAGFNLSDTPNDSTTFGYEEFELQEDTTELINAVYVIGEGVGLWREDATSIATYGRREMVLNDAEIKDTATANTRGDALIAGRKDPKLSGTVTIRRPGVNAGNSIQITNSGWGVSAQTFTVTAVNTSWVDQHSEALYQLAFGAAPTSLADTLGGIAGTAHDALQMAQATDALEPVADLSVAGANLVPNSSFESGSGGNWTVGSNWVVNYVSALPQEDAITGTKVARVALSLQTAGDLITPYIAISRTDDYWISAWSRLISRTSGTAVIEVQEFSAANALLATNVIASLTAAQAAWTRHSLRFGPNTAYGRTAWNASTAKVRILFRSLSGTLTWEVDGVQFERGKLLTAYAPSPQELVDGSITGTHMADLSVTLSKLATDSVDTSKLVNDSVNAAKIATGAVGTTEITDNAITTPKIVALAVDAGKIAASAVVADKIAANAVTTTKLDALAVTAAKLAAGSIIAEKIAAGAIETDKLAANAVVAGKVAASAITADALAANAVTANKIAAGAVTAEKLLVGQGRLLNNSDFESGDLSGWSASGGPTGSTSGVEAIEASYKGSGRWRAYSTNAAGGTGRELSQTIYGVQPGDVVQVSALLGGNGGQGDIVIGFVNSAGADLGYSSSPTFTFGISAAMVRQTKPGTAPAGTAGVRIILRNMTASKTMLVDDVVFSKGDGLITPDGTVAISPDGITVTSGKITVTNASGTVVIDGSSNMYKIVASGTISIDSFTGPSSGYAAIQLATGFTYRPAFAAWLLSASPGGVPSDNYAVVMPTHQLGGASGGVLPVQARTQGMTRVVNTNQTEFDASHMTALTGATPVQTVKYGIFREAAI